MAGRAVVTFTPERPEIALGGAAALLRSLFKTSMFLDRDHHYGWTCKQSYGPYIYQSSQDGEIAIHVNAQADTNG